MSSGVLPNICWQAERASISAEPASAFAPPMCLRLPSCQIDHSQSVDPSRCDQRSIITSIMEFLCRAQISKSNQVRAFYRASIKWINEPITLPRRSYATKLCARGIGCRKKSICIAFAGDAGIVGIHARQRPCRRVPAGYRRPAWRRGSRDAACVPRNWFPAAEARPSHGCFRRHRSLPLPAPCSHHTRRRLPRRDRRRLQAPAENHPPPPMFPHKVRDIHPAGTPASAFASGLVGQQRTG